MRYISTTERPGSVGPGGLGWAGMALAVASVGFGGAMLARGILRYRRYFDLKDKVAVVTGGSRGIGLAIARELVSRGAKIAICARDEREMRDALEDLESRGGDVLAVTCDVTQADEISNVIERTRERFGPIDVLVNNAGIIVVGPASAMTISDYRDTMDVNFEAPLLFMLDVIPEMRQRKQGRIVNIASFGGKVPAPHLATYCASKFALVGLSETLRTELVDDNVFVTTVCPGLTRSGSSGHAKFKGRRDAEHKWFEAAANSPLMTIAPERLARRIVDALVVGQAELTTPISAFVETKLQGLFPGVAAEIITFFNRLLPAAVAPTPARQGVDLAHVPSELLQRRQERAEQEFNEDEEE